MKLLIHLCLIISVLFTDMPTYDIGSIRSGPATAEAGSKKGKVVAAFLGKRFAMRPGHALLKPKARVSKSIRRKTWRALSTHTNGRSVPRSAMRELKKGAHSISPSDMKEIQSAANVHIARQPKRYAGIGVSRPQPVQGAKFWKNRQTFKGVVTYRRDDIFVSDKANIERMRNGSAPIGRDGHSVEIHHMIQRDEHAVAEILQTSHKRYFDTIHINPQSVRSGVARPEFDAWRAKYWRNRAKELSGR